MIIVITLILHLGVSGCKSNTATYDELVLARDVYYIVYTISMYNALYPSEPLDYGITLEVAKKIVDEYFWPAGLSDEEEKAAWKLIVLKDNRADLTPKAKEVLQEGSRDESGQVKIANATMIVKGINVYNAINLNHKLPDDLLLADVKEALEGERI